MVGQPFDLFRRGIFEEANLAEGLMNSSHIDLSPARSR
jgi:hypothetical protein